MAASTETRPQNTTTAPPAAPAPPPPAPPADCLARVKAEMTRVLIGQDELVTDLLLALLTGGHVLIEGVPGLAKTLAAQTLAAAVGARFGRVQFTPDLLPADLVGTEVFVPGAAEFSVRPGSIFTQILLADEINRAPAKVQSALLEAMQERQVTIGRQTLPLDPFFLVLATQNPIEQHGTYPLPEAQIDRFLMKVVVRYPDADGERRILLERSVTARPDTVAAVVDPAAILALRPAVDAVHLEPRLLDYILSLVRATRAPGDYGLDLGALIEWGASPRGGIALVLAAKAHALLSGRDYSVPHDVKTVAPAVLRHRILPSVEAEADGIGSDHLVARILAELPVP